MNQTQLQKILSTINSYEDFEDLKSNKDIWESLVKDIVEQHHFPKAPLYLFKEGTNIVFSCGNDEVIKIYS
jgi:hygromycin-B 7''-O-kinase